MPERFMRGIEAVNGIVWGPVGLGLLFGTGLLLTVRTGVGLLDAAHPRRHPDRPERHRPYRP